MSSPRLPPSRRPLSVVVATGRGDPSLQLVGEGPGPVGEAGAFLVAGRCVRRVRAAGPAGGVVRARQRRHARTAVTTRDRAPLGGGRPPLPQLTGGEQDAGGGTGLGLGGVGRVALRRCRPRFAGGAVRRRSVHDRPLPLAPLFDACQLGRETEELDVRQRDDLAAVLPGPGPAGAARPAAGAGVLLALEIGGGDPPFVRLAYGGELLLHHIGPAGAVRGQFPPVEFGARDDDEVLGRVAVAEDQFGDAGDEMGEISGLFKPIDHVPLSRGARVPVHPVGPALVPAPSRPCENGCPIAVHCGLIIPQPSWGTGARTNDSPTVRNGRILLHGPDTDSP
ncbi:hypothetical protein GPN2_23158 [Streptomyces murinus]